MESSMLNCRTTTIVNGVLLVVLVCLVVYLVFFKKDDCEKEVDGFSRQKLKKERYVQSMHLSKEKKPHPDDAKRHARLDMLSKKYSLSDSAKVVSQLQKLILDLPAQMVSTDTTGKMTLGDAAAWMERDINEILKKRHHELLLRGDEVGAKVVESFFSTRSSRTKENWLGMFGDAMSDAFWETENSEGGSCGHGMFLKGLVGCANEEANPILDGLSLVPGAVKTIGETVVSIPSVTAQAFTFAKDSLQEVPFSESLSSASRAVIETDFAGAFSDAYDTISDIQFREIFAASYENAKRSLSILDGRNIDRLLCQMSGTGTELIVEGVDALLTVNSAKGCYGAPAAIAAINAVVDDTVLMEIFGPVAGPVVSLYFTIYTAYSAVSSCAKLVKQAYEAFGQYRDIPVTSLAKVHRGDLQARHCGHSSGALGHWIHPNKIGGSDSPTLTLDNCVGGTTASDDGEYTMTGTFCQTATECCQGGLVETRDPSTGYVTGYGCGGVVGTCNKETNRCIGPNQVAAGCTPIIRAGAREKSYLGCSTESMNADNGHWMIPNGEMDEYRATGRPLPIMFPPAPENYDADGKYIFGGPFNERTIYGDNAMFNYRQSIGDNIIDKELRIASIMDGTCGPK